jgi:hypothetical protein
MIRAIETRKEVLSDNSQKNYARKFQKFVDYCLETGNKHPEVVNSNTPALIITYISVRCEKGTLRSYSVAEQERKALVNHYDLGFNHHAWMIITA